MRIRRFYRVSCVLAFDDEDVHWASEPVITTMGFLGCDDSETPTTKKVANINSCSVKLSEESFLRVIFIIKRNKNHDSVINHHSCPFVSVSIHRTLKNPW